MDRFAQRRAGALALLLGLMASCCHAADAPAPGGSFRPPHLLTPDAPLFPDYYALALEHTSAGTNRWTTMARATSTAAARAAR